MMRILPILFCFFICSTLVSQTNGPVHLKFVDKESKAIIDGLGNIYVIHVDEIKKYNPAGVFLKTFSNKRYGKIDDIDVSNPLKILVYYKDFQQVLFLDNQLSLTSNVISLETIGYEQTSLVCSSINNSFWLYDKQNNELLRFDSELKTLVKTGNLKRILDIDIKPNYMREHNNYVYLNCPQEGVLVFDIYGTFYKTIPIKQLTEFNIINGNIFYYDKPALKEYQAQTFNTIEKIFPDTLLKKVYWKNDKYYELYSDSLIINGN
ncbi:MAG: hypothetical protein V4506_17005 [Bacteroidota bacterium]